MRIDWTPGLRPPTQRRDDRGIAADRSFALDPGGEPGAGATAQGAAAAQPMAGLLLLQEIADELPGRRRAVARGDKLLDALEQLRLALLAGAMPRAQLEALATMVQDHLALIDDPGLAELLAEIELRAAVELAKLQYA